MIAPGCVIARRSSSIRDPRLDGLPTVAATSTALRFRIGRSSAWERGYRRTAIAQLGTTAR